MAEQVSTASPNEANARRERRGSEGNRVRSRFIMVMRLELLIAEGITTPTRELVRKIDIFQEIFRRQCPVLSGSSHEPSLVTF